MNQSLPLFPLFNGSVLLPGGFLKVKSNESSFVSALLDHLFSTQSSPVDDIIAVAVPITGPSLNTDENESSIDLNRAYHIGTAVRVLEISRMASQDSSWSIVLQGVCRMSIIDVLVGPQGIYIAKVHQLDYFQDRDLIAGDGEGTSSEESTSSIKKAILQDIKTLLSAAAQQHHANKHVGQQTVRLLEVNSLFLTRNKLL